MEKRANRQKVLTGTVLSDKMMKTRVVQVRSLERHAKYDKLLVTHKKYKAHDENNESHVGDVVSIQETRPLSKDKRWVIVQIVAKNANKEAVAI
ncbi:MAG: 30S ribosomal protein S17 [Candidatus Omnitrophica bacterium]|nr:30S ribosomal protein S17 [Candidatus Omnitrophota bacterium]